MIEPRWEQIERGMGIVRPRLISSRRCWIIAAVLFMVAVGILIVGVR
jgi:hypothetical protein